MRNTRLPLPGGRGLNGPLRYLLALPVLLISCLLIVSPRLSAGQSSPLVVDGNPNQISYILPHSTMLADPHDSYSAAQLFSASAPPFKALSADNPSFQAPAGTYWFKFTLINTSGKDQRLWLSTDFLVLEHVDLYKRGVEQPLRTGALYVNPKWLSQERLHDLPIDLKQGETAEYLLHIKSRSQIRLATKLFSDHSHTIHSGNFNVQLGLIYGVLFTLFVFTINLYISLRDKIFVSFLVYILALTMQSLASQGSIKLLFPGDELISNLAGIAGSVLNLVAGAFFVRYFLLLPENNPRLDKLILATGIVPVIVVSLIPLSTEQLETAVIIAGGFSLVANIYVSSYRLIQHYTPAAFILAANLLVFIPLFLWRLLPERYIPVITAATIINSTAVLKAVILGCGLTSLIDNLNKTLSREVSERKNRESQLMHAQQIARYGDWSWDTDNNRFSFSESALDILPALADGDENDFEKLLKRATSRQKRKIRAAFGNAVKEQQGFDTEFSLLHDDGSTHYYLTRAEFQRDSDGKVTPLLIGTIHDITDSKLAGIAYRENEQRWRELADSTFEAILIYQDDIIIDANLACEQLLGFSPTQLIGTSGETFVERASLSSMLITITEAADKPIELTLKNSSGDDINVEIRSRTGTFNQQSVQIVAIRDISERKQHEEQLLQLGYYDSLTGLANRTLFQERVQHAIDKSRRYAQKHALLFIDLDQFKHVNDSLGHDIGDQLLIEVGRRLKTRVRKEDTVARLGGDEFAILVEDITAPYAAAKVADEILRVMSEPITVDEYQLKVTPSIGIAVYPADGDTGGELLRKADTAMYHAKSQGRNNYQFYTEALNEKIIRRMDLESELRVAVENDSFILHYQPKVDLTSGNIVGAEALLRWNSDKFGMVPPDEFIPIAEETGLIWPIGELVLEHACQQALEWLKIYPGFGSIAVNISGIQFNHSNLVETVAEVLQKTNIPARHLELEITEGAIIDNAEEAIAIMGKLKELGVKLSLDDFGTGYSSLNYLKRFPVDSLKIDRSFVAEIVGDKTGQLIADNIVKLAHNLKLNIVAEGVETVEQLNTIRAMGCDELQGYIFSRPLPSEEMNAMLANNSNLYDINSPSAGNL